MPANAYRVISPANYRMPSRATDILTIGEHPIVAAYLSGLFEPSGWSMAHRRTYVDAISFLRNHRAAVAVCEETLPDGTWHDAVAAFASLPDAPALIVIGSDPSVQQEVTALGGFDALIRPLRESDVIWSIASAWHTWRKRAESGGAGGPRCPGA